MISAFNFAASHFPDGIWLFTAFGLSFVGTAVLMFSRFDAAFCLLRAADVKAQYSLYLLLQENVLKLPESSREAVIRSRRNYLKTRGITVFNGGEV